MTSHLLQRLTRLERRRKLATVPPLEIIVDFTEEGTAPENIETVSTRIGDMLIETVLTSKVSGTRLR